MAIEPGHTPDPVGGGCGRQRIDVLLNLPHVVISGIMLGLAYRGWRSASGA
jgi:hypothetical protein